MSMLLTQEQIRVWLKENNLRDGASIERAFAAEIENVVQAALEEEMSADWAILVMIVRIRLQIIVGMVIRKNVFVANMV